MKRICKQCGKEFELSESEIGFYKGRGLELPKRCKACREQNKEQGKGQKQQQTQCPVSNHIGNDKDSRDHKNGTDKSRYIISAAAVLLSSPRKRQQRSLKEMRSNRKYSRVSCRRL